MLDLYLFGRSFIIQTDHNPIRWLNAFKGKNQRYFDGVRHGKYINSMSFIVMVETQMRYLEYE